MNWKRVGRLLVCLVLVAALLVQVSPIRAKAVSPGFVYVAASAVIMGILWGVGVSAGVNGSEAFLDVCNDALNGLTLNYDFITDDQKIKAWATGNPDMPWMIDESIIDALFGWIYGSGLVCNDSVFLTEWSLNISGRNYIYRSDDPFAALHLHYTLPSSSVCSCYIVTQVEDASFKIYENGMYKGWDKYNKSVGGYFCRFLTGTTSAGSLVCNGDYGDALFIEGSVYATENDALLSLFDAAASGTFSTSEDLTLGEVAPAGTPIPDGYSIWNDNAILVEDDDGSHYVYPLTLPADFEDIKDLSQGDIWEGIGSTYEDTTTDTETGSGTGTGTGSSATTGTAADVVTGVVSGLQDQTAQIGVWLGELIAGVQAIPQAIADVLTAIFVPSADYVTAKVESLRARFPFISSVISTGESLRDSISGSSGPPAIYVDLGRASSGNYGSQKVLLTDFAWYAEYKPTVDAVLSAALWAFFGWRVFLKLPGIISGESGVVGDISARAETYNKIKAGPPTKK